MVQFNDTQLEEFNRLVARYPYDKRKSALLPVLHLAQESFGGWLSAEVMDYVASLLGISSIEVYEVATFYSMYNLKPVGAYTFEFCQTGPCLTRGVEDIIRYTENKLNIKVGQVTQDGIFGIKTVECLGACGYAPMMQLGKYYKEYLTEEKIDQIIAEYRQRYELMNKN